MRESFERVSATVLDLDRVRQLLHDVEKLASCSNYVGPVETIAEGQAWETSLENKVGPFKLTAPIRVQITDEHAEEQSGLFRLAISARGQDRGLGTRLMVDASMTFTSEPEPTVKLEGTYDVTGRIAALGGSVVRQQADVMVNDFWSNLQEHLNGGSG